VSKLREAAQALLEAVEDEGVRGMDTAIKALRDALAEDALDEMQALTESEYNLACLSETHQQLSEALEYEFIGTLDGTYGGRWVLWVEAENASAVWPDGTAVYVRRSKE